MKWPLKCGSSDHYLVASTLSSGTTMPVWYAMIVTVFFLNWRTNDRYIAVAGFRLGSYSFCCSNHVVLELWHSNSPHFHFLFRRNQLNFLWKKQLPTLSMSRIKDPLEMALDPLSCRGFCYVQFPCLELEQPLKSLWWSFRNFKSPFVTVESSLFGTAEMTVVSHCHWLAVHFVLTVLLLELIAATSLHAMSFPLANPWKPRVVQGRKKILTIVNE